MCNDLHRLYAGLRLPISNFALKQKNACILFLTGSVKNKFLKVLNATFANYFVYYKRIIVEFVGQNFKMTAA